MTPAAALAVVAPGLDHSDARPLGEGVWGRVLDLGDGTVVKLVRQGAGFGEATELWANEVAALRALQGRALPFAVPRVVDAALLDEAATGFRCYARLTRIPGHALDDDSLEGSGDRFAHQLGEALAALHALEPAGVFDDTRAEVDHGYLARITDEVADIAGPAVIAAIAAGLESLEEPGTTVVNHGDVNSTNIMVDGAGDLVGLIDWAEARRDWREAEFCHIALMPRLLARVRPAYKAAAGVNLDDGRLDLVGLQNALTGISICRRLGEAEEVAWNIAQARRLMVRLGL